MKSACQIIIIILLLVTIFSIASCILFHPSPFQSAEEKKTKSLYHYSTENVKNKIDLRYVSAEEDTIEYTLIFKKFNDPDILNSDEIRTSYDIVMQALNYLNSSENNIKIYSIIRFEFRVGHGRSGPDALNCFITKSSNTYEFTKIDAGSCCLLADLSVMKDVQYINYEYNGDFYENLGLLSNLTAIKEINIKSSFVNEYENTIDDLSKIVPGCIINWNE